MGEIWIKEAERLTPVGNHNAMSGIGGPRATLHCTVSFPGSFDAMHRVLTTKSSEPHLLYDPKTDRLGQYFPLDRAARALARGTLPYSHNRVGSRNIQVEVCEMPRDWTTTPDWNPGPNFRAMLRAIRSNGIRDEFVFRPAKSGTDRANVVRPDRLLTSTEGGGKWWGHCHYGQGESHYDPGPIDVARFFAAAPSSAPQEDEVTPQDIKDIADEVWGRWVYDANGDAVDMRKAVALALRNSTRAAADSAVARGLAEAQAVKGEALTAAEIDAIGAAVGEKLAGGFDVRLEPKAGA